MEINLVNHCYDVIKEKVISGKYWPGSKLKISGIAAELKIGPTPIREALSRLSTTGLVKYIDNCGFIAAPVSETEMRDLFQTFVELEQLALEKALSHGQDAWKTGIVAALYQLSLVEKGKTLTPDLYPLWKERNDAFHRALIAGCPSACLLGVRNDVYQRFDRYINLIFSLEFKNQESVQLDHKEHEILAAVALERDKKKMAILIKEHVTSSIDDIIQTFKQRNFI